LKEAQKTALKISDAATRDRVLVQIVRRLSYEKRIEDAVELTRRITDESARVELLVLLSSAAQASRDDVRAAELLDEAATYLLKARPTLERTRSLVMIASSFAAFDTVRSFAVVQSAVKAVNDLVRQQEASKDEVFGSERERRGLRHSPSMSFMLRALTARWQRLRRRILDGAPGAGTATTRRRSVRNRTAGSLRRRAY
jgi:hypothetical protein